MWQVRVRALFCLEALVKTTDPEVKRDALKLMKARFEFEGEKLQTVELEASIEALRELLRGSESQGSSLPR